MDDLRKNKLKVGAVTAALVCLAASFYVYLKNKDENEVIQQTFAFIKPDAFNDSQKIKKQILDAGFTIVKSRRIVLTTHQARLFYIEHQDAPFFHDLREHMISGPVWALVLERKNAIKRWRELIGATDPEIAKKEQPNSLRALYGTSKTANAFHGSDSLVSSQREIGFFFDM